MVIKHNNSFLLTINDAAMVFSPQPPPTGIIQAKTLEKKIQL